MLSNDNKIKSSKISKIEFAGEQDTYDIEVDSPEHLFLANGFVTSNSHAVAYAHLSYITAYAKAHYPEKFLCAYLKFAKEKPKPFEEVARLCEDARRLNITVQIPDIRIFNKEFEVIGDDIYFGLCNVKGVGEKVFEKIAELPDKNFAEYTWPETIFKVLLNVNKSCSKALMAVGALDHLKISRKKMLHEHECALNLSKKEIKFIDGLDLSKYNKLEAVVQCLLDDPKLLNKTRRIKVQQVLTSIESPPIKTIDTIKEVANWEESFLGFAITHTRFDNLDRSRFKARCKDLNNKTGNYTVIAQIRRINEIETKNGDMMAFMELSDDTEVAENCVMFPSPWDEFGKNLKPWQLVKAKGYLKDGSFIIQKCEVI